MLAAVVTAALAQASSRASPIGSSHGHGHRFAIRGCREKPGDLLVLMRIYAAYYANPVPAEASIRGTPIYSGHFRDDRQVFVAYHWLVRSDGSLERLLDDHCTGWHAGDWNVNCRSVGICLDGNFEDAAPDEPMVTAVACLVRDEYNAIAPSRVVGHCDVNPHTTCPGRTFADIWRGRLLDALK